MYCVFDCMRSTDGGYVELKTAFLKRMDDYLLPYAKCIHTWLQCTLAGVEKVVVGYKDDRGFVEKVIVAVLFIFQGAQ